MVAEKLAKREWERNRALDRLISELPEEARIKMLPPRRRYGETLGGGPEGWRKIGGLGLPS